MSSEFGPVSFATISSSLRRSPCASASSGSKDAPTAAADDLRNSRRFIATPLVRAQRTCAGRLYTRRCPSKRYARGRRAAMQLIRLRFVLEPRAGPALKGCGCGTAAQEWRIDSGQARCRVDAPAPGDIASVERPAEKETDCARRAGFGAHQPTLPEVLFQLERLRSGARTLFVHHVEIVGDALADRDDLARHRVPPHAYRIEPTPAGYSFVGRA